MARILIVDDVPGVAKVLCDFLTDEGHLATAAHDGRSALGVLERERFDLVISDIFMPRVDGLELIREIKSLTPSPAVIAMSGQGYGYINNAAAAFGAARVLAKPFERDDLLSAVDHVLRQRNGARRAAS